MVFQKSSLETKSKLCIISKKRFDSAADLTTSSWEGPDASKLVAVPAVMVSMVVTEDRLVAAAADVVSGDCSAAVLVAVSAVGLVAVKRGSDLAALAKLSSKLRAKSSGARSDSDSATP